MRVLRHDFSVDGEVLGTVCVPQAAVREGAAVLCVQDHRGDLVAEVRRAAGGFAIVCGGRPVAQLKMGAGEVEADCGAMDPRIVLALVPLLPESS
jgi:hypothetical protein